MIAKGLTPINIHVPPRYSSNAAISKFYSRVDEALLSSKKFFGVYNKNFHFSFYDPATYVGNKFHITYHTKGYLPNVIHAKVGYLEDFFYFDDDGYSGYSSIANSVPSKDELTANDISNFEFLIEKYVRNKNTKFRQKDLTKEDGNILDQRYIIFFGQKQGDSVLRLRLHEQEHIIDMLSSFCAMNNLKLYVKLHPKCNSTHLRDYVRRKIFSHKHIQIVDTNIHDLINNCVAVATINSGAGFESLLQFKKVLLFGKSDYAKAGFIINNIADVANAVNAEVNEKNIIRFVNWLLFRRKINSLDDRSPEKISRLIKAKIATGRMNYDYSS